MRRLAALLSLALIFAALNFSLWFYHSRAIESSLEFAKKVFAVKNIKMEYKDAYFNTFTFWSLKTTIDDLRFSTQDGQYIEFDKVVLTSLPIEKVINIKMSQQIYYQDNDLIVKNRKRVVFESAPSLVFELTSFIDTIKHGFLNSSAPNPFGNIESVYYQDTGLIVLDPSKADTPGKDVYYTVGPSLLSFEQFRKKSEAGFEIKINTGVLEYSNDYEALDEAKEVFKKVTQTGKNKFELILQGKSYFSEKYRRYLKDSKKQDFDISQARFDMFEFSFDKCYFHNAITSIEVTGKMRSAGSFSIPFFDFNIGVLNYKNGIHFYSDMHNKALHLLSVTDRPRAIDLSENKTKQLLNILQDVNGKGDDLNLHITRSEQIPNIEVNKKSFLIMLGMINEIFPNIISIGINK